MIYTFLLFDEPESSLIALGQVSSPNTLFPSSTSLLILNTDINIKLINAVFNIYILYYRFIKGHFGMYSTLLQVNFKLEIHLIFGK